MCIQFFRIYRFYRKNRRLQWSLPSLRADGYSRGILVIGLSNSQT